GPDLDPVPARAEPAGLHPRDLAEARANAAAWPDGPRPCETVRDAATLQRWIGEVRETGAVAFHAALTRSDPMLAEIAGLALAIAPGRACYVPLGRRAAGPQDLLGGGLAEGQIGAGTALEMLRSLLQDPSVLELCRDVRPALVALQQHGLDLVAHDDVMLISYVLDAGPTNHELDSLSRQGLRHEPAQLSDLTGAGRKAVGLETV